MNTIGRWIALLLPFLLAAAPVRQPVAFVHVNVIDTAGGATKADQTVVIVDERISAAGPFDAIKVPAGTKLIDARGKYLIPGLWDMHVHLLWEPAMRTLPRLMIANGVTGARDMGTHFSFERIRAWVGEIKSGQRVGPRFVYVGPIVDGVPPIWPGSIGVEDAAAARKAVRELKASGASFVKVYERLSSEAYFALADEAKKQQIRLVGHVPQSITPLEAADAGQYSIEHLSHFLDSCLAPDRISYDPAKGKVLIESFKRNRTWHCPTLITAETATFGREDRIANDLRHKYFNLSILSRVGFDDGGRDWNWTLRFWREERKLMKDMVGAGIEFLAGTDAPVVRNVPGFTLHDELKCLVDAGLTPMQALQAATRNPARFFGWEAEMGNIEPGKSADLVLLNEDPLTDIKNTTKIEAVVADGRLYQRGDLDRLLAEVEEQGRLEREVKVSPSPAPDGTQSGVMEFAGGKIFYEVRGSGQAVVLLHDGLLHRETWNAQWDSLPEKYKVIRYDRRGYGKSPPPIQPYSDVEDLAALLDHLKIDEATLVGCSAGGSLAIDFTLAHPAQVDRLVLVGAVVNGMEFADHFIQRNAAAFKPLRERGDVSKTIENWVKDPYFVSARNPRAKAILTKLLQDNPHDLGNEREHWRKQLRQKPAVKRLGEIKSPTLIIVGEDDIPDVHAQGGALQAGIGGSKRIVVSGSGHLVFMEQPKEFDLILDQFLER